MTHAEQINEIKARLVAHHACHRIDDEEYIDEPNYSDLTFLLSRLEAAEAVVEAAKRITHRDEWLHRAIVGYEGGGKDDRPKSADVDPGAIKHQLMREPADQKSAEQADKRQDGDICPACGAEFEDGAFKRCGGSIIKQRDAIKAESERMRAALERVRKETEHGPLLTDGTIAMVRAALEHGGKGDE